MSLFFSYFLALGFAATAVFLLHQEKRPIWTIVAVGCIGLIHAVYGIYLNDATQAEAQMVGENLKQELRNANGSIKDLQAQLVEQAEITSLETQAIQAKLDVAEKRGTRQEEDMAALSGQLDKAVDARDELGRSLSKQVRDSVAELGLIQQQLDLAADRGTAQDDTIKMLNERIIKLSDQNITLLSELSTLNRSSRGQAQSLQQTKQYAAKAIRQLEEQERIRKACEGVFFGAGTSSVWSNGVRCK